MKNSTKKLMLSIILVIIAITLLQSFSYAKTENVQMIKKSEKQYILYIETLLNNEFEFAFSKKANEPKENLVFTNSALDQVENGNNIAYIDETLYNTYFDEGTEAYLWVKQGDEYKVEAKKIALANALTENDIQEFNKVTKKISVKFGELNLPTETIEGVKVTRKMGTINIDDDSNTQYEYKMLKATQGSKVEELINLANEMNNLENKNMYHKLLVYSQFKEVYTYLKPIEGWKMAENNTIKQPQESKKGEKYLVWLKGNDAVDIQIMTCNDEYTPEYENQKVVNKVVTKLPITGESLTIYIIALVLLILIIAVIVLKVKNKSGKKE